MKPIIDILKKYKLDTKDIINYGEYIAKIKSDKLTKTKEGKLILVTATSPTSSGEGKTTISINLTDALNSLNKRAIVALREPSIGPCFGVKGGATGAGLASIVPEDKINLHFTGDFHAITTANNLIAAVIDNEIYQKSDLNIDFRTITHTRVMDMNDRSLRNIQVAINKDKIYTTRFDITSSCELMTIFCLSKDKEDFIKRLEDMVVAYNNIGEPVTVKQLNITNAIMAIMEDCFYPNYVQTLEGSLASVHGGPFANISIGVSTYLATKTGLKLSDYLVTEAGFGSDLGAEKFLNILCQENGLKPSCIVLVTTIKSIFNQGDNKFEKGVKNLEQHIKHLKNYKIPFVVAINKFDNDKDGDIKLLTNWLDERKVSWALDTGFKDGSKGGIELAKLVMKKARTPKSINYIYSPEDTLKSKIESIAKDVYGIDNVLYSEKAQQLVEKYSKNGYYVCISKQPGQIPSNIIDNKPSIVVNDILLNTASRIAVVLCDKVFRMPGLPVVPRAKSWN